MAFPLDGFISKILISVKLILLNNICAGVIVSNSQPSITPSEYPTRLVSPCTAYEIKNHLALNTHVKIPTRPSNPFKRTFVAPWMNSSSSLTSLPSSTSVAIQLIVLVKKLKIITNISIHVINFLNFICIHSNFL